MNPYYRGLGPSHLAWMFTSAHMGHYIPLTWITLGFAYLLWGMNPLGYHLTNVCFSRGSSTSRSPSPRRFIARTLSMIPRPGKVEIHASRK